MIDSLLLQISEQDQEEHVYGDRQEQGNQKIESSEHESSSGSIGQSQRQPDISWEVKQVNFVIKFSTAQNI